MAGPLLMSWNPDQVVEDDLVKKIRNPNKPPPKSDQTKPQQATKIPPKTRNNLGDHKILSHFSYNKLFWRILWLHLALKQTWDTKRHQKLIFPSSTMTNIGDDWIKFYSTGYYATMNTLENQRSVFELQNLFFPFKISLWVLAARTIISTQNG